MVKPRGAAVRAAMGWPGTLESWRWHAGRGRRCPARFSSFAKMTADAPAAGGTALSMNWDDVGKRDYSKKGKEGEEDDEEWAPRSGPSKR